MFFVSRQLLLGVSNTLGEGRVGDVGDGVGDSYNSCLLCVLPQITACPLLRDPGQILKQKKKKIWNLQYFTWYYKTTSNKSRQPANTHFIGK
jgi:hypothetical protein